MHKIDINPVLLERGIWNRDGARQSHTALDMSKTAHVVVDMQRVYLEPEACCEVPNAREAIPNINAISKAVRAKGGLNIFIRNIYTEDEEVVWDAYYKSFNGKPFSDALKIELDRDHPHSAISPLLDRTDAEPIIEKARFSAFAPGVSRLHEFLQEQGIETLIVSGTLTNCCAESTARDALQYGYNVIFGADSTGTITDEEHNATLGNLYVVFADVVTTEEIVALVEAATPANVDA